MQLIIGGAFQGKKEYVCRNLSVSEEQMADGSKAAYEDIFRVKCMYHFHEWIRERIKEERNMDNLEELILQKNPDLILISNELGYGVVPVEAFDRRYRETTGRVCTRIASRSSQVIRVVCGMGMVIKND